MTVLAAMTQTELLKIGLEISGIALILGAFLLLLTGTSGPLGTSLRSALEPLLQQIRDQTSLSRPELADVTILVAVVLAFSSALFEQRILAVVVAIGLWLARPSVRRFTREENRLLAVAGNLSIDMVIGFYTPLTLAQFLFGDLLMGASFLAVVVALSWPAGGATIPGRRWRLAPVAAS
jgi:hypothetical protein